MTSNQNINAVPGWVGGFAESNPAFAYPEPNLTSLPMLDNMANITLLQRQQKVLWPEFSWETVPKAHNSRCFTMFSPDISRIGYTDTGRIYSIICPQQGACNSWLGCLNVEITVTGQRGWVNETNPEVAADMTVEAKIWFSPRAKLKLQVQRLGEAARKNNHSFPSNKANAIIVPTHEFNNPNQPIFPIRTGMTDLFVSPDFAQHPEAYAVGNIAVQIGSITKTRYPFVNEFNELVMSFFNRGSGNMLLSGNLLSWNLWFAGPELVDTAEWQAHAEKWRESIDADHGSPTGSGIAARYFDGTPFKTTKALKLTEASIEEEGLERIDAFLKKYS